MQILHPFSGSIQQYCERLNDAGDADRHRPQCCFLCKANKPLKAHGFYCRTVVDKGCDRIIRVRRYLCRICRRTISLLPEFVLPFVRFAILVLALFLKARLLEGQTIAASAAAADMPEMPYQRGQNWVRRFQKQAAALSAALVSLVKPAQSASFTTRALIMLQTTGWIPAHRFLFSHLRIHLLGWPCSLTPDGRPRTLRPA
jgi:hypothetical protein